MKIAPDVEKLMWFVAESADPQAVADFESRFPELRYELSKRIDLVRGLKASKKIAASPTSIPAFRPPVSHSQSMAMRWKWSIVGVALSALAVGSFVVTRQILNPPYATPPTGVVMESPPSTIPPRVVEENGVKRDPEPGILAPDSGQSGVQLPDDEPVAVPTWLRPQTVKFERLGLANALKAIASQCGLNLVMPPDMPNDEIVLDYQNMNAFEILADMGSRFGFTAFDQGGGQVLIIPARANSAGPVSGSDELRPVNPNVRAQPSSEIGG